jgi:hypothetical protein
MRFIGHRPVTGTEEVDKKLAMDEPEFLVAQRGPNPNVSSSGANWQSDPRSRSSIVFRSACILGQESAPRAASADAVVVSRVPCRLDDSSMSDFEDIRDEDGFDLHGGPEQDHARTLHSRGWGVQHGS